MLDGTILYAEKDSVSRAFERTGTYTTASLYRELTFPGVMNRWMLAIWEANLPLKIKIFLWLVCNDRIQSADQLVRRKWPGDANCKMCGLTETTEHIILRCALAQFTWCLCREAFGWPFVPTSVESFQDQFLEGVDRKTKFLLFLFGCIAWSLWLIRNEF
jgi:hypothetical protein